MKTKSLVSALFLLFAGAFIAFALPTAQRGTLSVTVLDNVTHSPIKDATIEVIETKQKAKTDASGVATLAVTVGQTGSSTYTVKADHPSYIHQIQKNISVSANQTTNISFSLVAGIEKEKKISTYSKEEGFSPGVLAPQMSGAGTYARKGIGGGFMGYDQDYNTEDYSSIAVNEFKSARENPLSTFSIDVDNASYSNVRRFIMQGSAPPKDAVRIEEMINYFAYDYPQPKSEHPFSINTEATVCPWDRTHQLVLVGLQGKDIPKENLPPSNLTFLIDVSGSMEGPTRIELVKKSMRLLVDQLREEDKVSIVVYAGAAGLVLPPTSGSDKKKILAALEELRTGGSTAGGAGIKLAYATARENYNKSGNNRVILCTDGDFNVGVSSDGELQRIIEKELESGVFLTVLGYGMGNYKDNKLETLADKGNGNYGYIDNLLEAQKMLVTQMGGTLNTIAKDVKIQIEFNPAKVKGYRLIGYENRLLAKEDFNNDKKDAGELGAGHTVTALYEIIPAGIANKYLDSVDALKYQSTVVNSSEELMTVKFRYKEPKDSVSKLITQPLKAADITTLTPSNNIKWAMAVAEFGQVLRDSKFKGNSTIQSAFTNAKAAKGKDDEGYRAEFIKLIEMYKTLDKAAMTEQE
ncbi:MAG TPA: von Willebrand factor type A domain-containing protein [Candidatus Kapabacteria bacterium]